MKRWIFTLLIIVFSAIFLISAGFLANYFYQSFRQKSAFGELAQIKESAAQQIQEDNPDAPGEIPQSTEPERAEENEPQWTEVTDPETGETVTLLSEFADLYVMNNDIVGWIQIENTFVNYPVMQKPEYTDYYLYLDFAKQYSRHGSIYVREECDVFTPSDNVVIYGHRMGDGTMFNTLLNYTDKDYYNEHPTILFDTLTERHTYEIMAVFRIDVYADSFAYHLFVDAEDEAQFNEYVNNCLSRAYYDTGVRAAYGDKLITLSTCEYTTTNGRLVVVAKRIS